MLVIVEASTVRFLSWSYTTSSLTCSLHTMSLEPCSEMPLGATERGMVAATMLPYPEGRSTYCIYHSALMYEPRVSTYRQPTDFHSCHVPKTKHDRTHQSIVFFSHIKPCEAQEFHTRECPKNQGRKHRPQIVGPVKQGHPICRHGHMSHCQNFWSAKRAWILRKEPSRGQHLVPI